MIVRDALPEDHNILLGLESPNMLQARGDYFARANQYKDHKIIVAAEGDRIAGTTSVALTEVTVNGLTRLAAYSFGTRVAPDFQRAGLGSSLLTLAELWAISRGAHYLTGLVDPRNLSSIRLVTGQGMNPVTSFDYLAIDLTRWGVDTAGVLTYMRLNMCSGARDFQPTVSSGGVGMTASLDTGSATLGLMSIKSDQYVKGYDLDLRGPSPIDAFRLIANRLCSNEFETLLVPVLTGSRDAGLLLPYARRVFPLDFMVKPLGAVLTMPERLPVYFDPRH